MSSGLLVHGMNLELSWQGPFEFGSQNGRSLFLAPEGARAGVYVWAVQTTAGLLPHYVGETKDSFATRHVEHFQAYASGVYSTRDADAFVMGHELVLHPGAYWKTPNAAAYQPFIDNFARFADHIGRILAAIHLFVAPLTADQWTRRRVEAGLVTAFYRAAPDALALFPPGFRRWGRRPDEEPLVVICQDAPNVVGFPVRFEA